jgi:hypothetical protein
MHLDRLYRQTFQGLERTNILKGYRSFANQLLVALDGTEYFSSKQIQCENCSHRILKNGETNYFHTALTPVIVQAGNEHVMSLEAEYIVPQDGPEKQDCETQVRFRLAWLYLFCLSHPLYFPLLRIADIFEHVYPNTFKTSIITNT